MSWCSFRHDIYRIIKEKNERRGGKRRGEEGIGGDRRGEDMTGEERRGRGGEERRDTSITCSQSHSHSIGQSRM